MAEPKRCGWVKLKNPLYVRYHDEEWGVPVHDDQVLFEMLCLEGAQAGLSWETILNKRAGYREVFAGFDPEVLARWRPTRIERLMKDERIVRNRLKIVSVLTNARAYLTLREQEGSLSELLWTFVGGQPIQSRPRSTADIPARTDLSDALSKELKRRGFKFVGSTICYAFMQAVGLVNDHTTGCFRYKVVRGLR